MADKLILVVDDEGMVKEYLEELIGRHGYHHAAFTDPKEALIFFAMNTNRIAGVVADIKMPGMTGYELAGEMLKINAHIPVILISAYFPSLDSVRETPNVKRVLSKPISSRLLLEALEIEIREANQKAV